MKALTLYQPWASLIAIGAKKIETRNWQTPYRGPVVITASLRFDDLKELDRAIYMDQYKWGTASDFHRFAIEAIYEHEKREIGGLIPMLPLGYALCVVDLVDIIRMRTDWIATVSEKERVFGNYAPGRYAWILRNVRMFKEPIRCSGHLSLWDWTLPLPEIERG